MYSDRRGTDKNHPDKTCQTKDPLKKDPRTIEREFVQRVFVRDFCTRPVQVFAYRADNARWSHHLTYKLNCHTTIIIIMVCVVLQLQHPVVGWMTLRHHQPLNRCLVSARRSVCRWTQHLVLQPMFQAVKPTQVGALTSSHAGKPC